MKVQIENIEFNFKQCGSDLLRDEDNLGIAHLIMPGKMADRFARENDGLIPHYDEEETRDARGSEHECYNSDTQIVLMHWLFKKRRKYKIDYYGLDPFWICHDSFHAKHDVWGMEVQNVYSRLELERLLQGAERAKKLGVGMTADTLIKLQTRWKSRWTFWEGNKYIHFNMTEFYKYMDDEQREIAEFWESDPQSYQSPRFPERY
jgi:hypothetical protein